MAWSAFALALTTNNRARVQLSVQTEALPSSSSLFVSLNRESWAQFKQTRAPSVERLDGRCPSRHGQSRADHWRPNAMRGSCHYSQQFLTWITPSVSARGISTLEFDQKRAPKTATDPQKDRSGNAGRPKLGLREKLVGRPGACRFHVQVAASVPRGLALIADDVSCHDRVCCGQHIEPRILKNGHVAADNWRVLLRSRH